MDELSATLKIGADASGVEAGVNVAKKSIASLGGAAANAGKQGADGINQIGAGGEQAARRVERATQNTIASIQRQIAAFEAGDKASRKYQESLAAMRGIDVAALKPYLDQLDAAKAKAGQTATATDALRSSAASLATSLAALGVSLSVGAFTVYAKGIINSIDALNDLKDATGATIENISALEDVAMRTGANMDVVSTALVKLNQGLNSSKPGSDTENAIKAIGLSVSELKSLDPVEAFQRIAVALSGYADDANKARLTQELFGKSLKEVAPLLKDLAEAGQLNAKVTAEQAAQAEAFNKQLFNLQKNSLDSGRAIAAQLLPAINDSIDRFRLAYKYAGDLYGVLKLYAGLDYGKTIQGNLADMEKRVEALKETAGKFTYFSGNRDNSKAIADLEKQIAYLKELRQLRATENVGDTSDAVSRKYLQAKSVGEFQTEKAAKAVKEKIDDATKGVNLFNDLISKGAGFNADYAEKMGLISAAAAGGKLSLDEVAKAVELLNAEQPGAIAAAKAEADAEKARIKAWDDVVKAREKVIESYQKSGKAVEAAVQKLADEEAGAALAAEKNISLAQAIEEVELARLRETQAKIQSEGADAETLLAIQKEIEAREQLVKATAAKATREANAKAAKEAAEEWKRAAERIESSITDALMRAFESGKSPAEALASTIRNMFATMVLRPVVSAGVNAATSAVGSAAGSAAASFAGSAFASTIGIEGLKNGQLQFSESAMQSMSKFADGATTVGNALNYLDAANSASQGKWGSAAGQALGTYYFGPLGGIVGKSVGDAIDKAFGGGGDGTPTRNLGDIRQTYDRSGSVTKTETAVFISDQARQTAKAMSDSYFAAARALGVTAATSQFGFGSNNIDGGKVIATSSVGGKTYNSNEVDPSLLQLVASRAVLSALQGSDLPKYLANVFNNLDVTTASQDAINAAIAYAQSLKTVRESLLSVGDYTGVLKSRVDAGFNELKTSADNFRADFVKAIDAGLTPEQLTQWQELAGNMNALSQATNDYSLAVRSQADILKERQGLQEQLDRLTLTSAELLKRQRDALDDSNKALFDQVQKQTDVKRINAENASWAEKYALLTGAATQRQVDRQRDLDAATDLTTKALIDAYYSQLDFIDAAAAATQAQDDYNAALVSAKDKVTNAIAAVNAALAGVDAVRSEGTNAYLTALNDVNAAQARLANLQLQSQIDIAKAANDAAKQMGDLGRQLHDFVDGLTIKPSDAFAKTLTAALAGDKAAMQALPGAATGAIDAARAGAGSATEFAILQGRILAQVNAVALMADAASNSTVTVPSATDPTVAAQNDLAAAQIKLTEALRVANAIGAPLTSTVGDLIVKFSEAQATAAKAQSDLLLAQKTLGDIAGNTADTFAAVTKASSMAAKDAAAVRLAILNDLVSSIGNIDLNKDGLLTVDEFVKGMSGKATDAELRAIYAQADSNHDGVLTKLEAIAAANAAVRIAILTDLVGSIGAIDLNKDGLLTIDEFVKGMAGKATDAQLKAIYAQADANNDGVVTKLEAIEAAASATRLAILGDLVSSIGNIDLNKDGLLTIAEFKAGMAGKATDAELSNIFDQADTNHDGLVSRLEAIAAYSKVTSEKDFSTTVVNSASSSVVTFAADDPIRSVFNNISRTNDLMLYIAGNTNAYLSNIWAQTEGTKMAAQDLRYYAIYGDGLLVKFFRGDKGVGTYATGGAFTNGIVSRPTAFNASLMGEAGPEAIMPLANVNGSLGVRVVGGGDTKTADEIRALREENRAQASALVQLMQRLTKLNERWDATGIPETRVTA